MMNQFQHICVFPSARLRLCENFFVRKGATVRKDEDLTFMTFFTFARYFLNSNATFSI